MGQMALSNMVNKGNLSAVDNRYGRAGLFVLMSPIYGLAATADLFIINSVEFWSGTNPVSQRPAVVDMPVEAIFNINQHLDPQLTTAPLPQIKLTKATLNAPNEQTLIMALYYEDGSQHLLSAIKQTQHADFYLDGTFITRASLKEIVNYAG